MNAETWVVIGGVVSALSVLAGLYLKMGKIEDRIGDKLLLQVKALMNGGEKTSVEISPSPVKVEMEERFVLVSSYHKHAELNRDAHEKLEQKLCDAVEAQTAKLDKAMHAIHELSADMRALKAVGDIRSAQMSQLDSKVDAIRRHQA